MLSLVGMTFFLSWYLWKNRQKALHSPPFWWKVILMAALGGSLVMTLFHAQRIWEAIPALTFIQFPWRFLAVVGVLAATISGEVLSALHIRWQRWGLALILCTLALAQVRFHQPQSFLDRPYDLYVVEPGRIQTKMSGILPDFIPAGFDRSLPPIDSSQRIVLNNHTLKEDFSTPHRLRFFGEGQAEGTILWNIADFPGWQYYVNDQPVEPELREDGRREYTIQEPVESVGAIFTATPVRIWGQWISVGALFILLLLALPFRVPGLKIKSSKHVKT